MHVSAVKAVQVALVYVAQVYFPFVNVDYEPQSPLNIIQSSLFSTEYVLQAAVVSHVPALFIVHLSR